MILLSAVVLFLSVTAGLYAEPMNPNTDWFRDAGWGVFVHYLWDVQCVGDRINTQDGTTDWDACVMEFDTERFADDIAETGAGYVIFTMHQRTRYLIAPNKRFDELTGYAPGQACSTRDLVADLYTSLHKRGIPLMLYWTGDGPRQDKKASDGLGGWHGKITDEYVRNWASVVAEYGNRYGDKVVGWWVDGCYGHIGYDQEKLGVLAKGLKAGNPKRIIAMNPGVALKAYSKHEDYMCGEMNSFGTVPESRFVDGEQWHILSYLGSRWGGAGLRYSKDWMADYLFRCHQVGGVVSIDVLLFRDGSIDLSQKELLKGASARLKAKLEKLAHPVPPGNLAYGKPATLLSLDGSKTLPVNGGGGSPREARYGVDGDPKTFAQASSEWPWTYQVDLQKPLDINKVVVTFGPDGFATDYEISLSIDAKNWRTAASKKDQKGQKISLDINGGKNRYIRISALKPNGPDQPGGQMQIAELEVYQ